ncbi:MAG TPA: DHHA1 domain-containing protein, partial [Dehalococcoidales bacterium]|nr:DHHA1 domain-containing protein [Dehalococcoidales bacterium]
PEEIKNVQRLVNDKIRRNVKVYDEELPYQAAVKSGAIALFDEKYGDVVRVMRIGEPVISAELCGGTHVAFTGEIGHFHIVSEGSIGAGLRRIEAVTGRGAESLIEQRLASLEKIAHSLEASPDDVGEKVAGLAAELDKERKQVRRLEREISHRRADDLLAREETVKGIKVIASAVPSSSIEALREMSDRLRDGMKSGIVVLGSVYNDRPIFVAAVTPDLVARGYHAGDIVKKVSQVTGGGGGGKAGFAQAGGRDKGKLDEALGLVKSLI